MPEQQRFWKDISIAIDGNKETEAPSFQATKGQAPSKYL